MWETVKTNSYLLIFSSTLGYFSACMLLMLHFGALPSKYVRSALSLITVCAGIGAIISLQPNIGTELPWWGLLPYLGIFTLIATPMSLIANHRRAEKVLAIATFLVVSTGLIASLLWIIFGWLSALLIHYQPYLEIALSILIIATLWLGFRARNQDKSNKSISRDRMVFAMLIAAEATSIYLLANLLLLIFVGLALNP